MFDRFLIYARELQGEIVFYYPFLLKWLAVFWLIFFVNVVLFKGRLNSLGIYPRRRWGLLGVVFSPFLHGSFSHLFLNSVVLFSLGLCVLILNVHYFYIICLIIILLGGLLTWIFGRVSIHIGASGLIMGLWGYVMLNAYVRPSLLAVIVVVVCLYYFSGLFLNLFPTDISVSWEAHVFGFLAGVAAVFLTPVLGAWLSLN
jgi:membrane associated rhomboid family serine protease